MPTNVEKMHSSLKWFIVCAVVASIAAIFLLGAIWISTGDDTSRYVSTAALFGGPALVGGLISGVDYWG
jgi:hypothetical protein